MNIFISINSTVHCNYECVKWSLFPYSKVTDFCFHFCVCFSVCLVFPYGFLKNFYFSNKEKEHFIISNTRKICTIIFVVKSWIIKKAEQRRTDTFEFWCWKRLLRIPWTIRRSNQSILKETSPGCSLEGLMLKLGHLMWRVDSLEKTLILGGIGGRRRRGWQRMRWLDGIADSMDMSLSELWEWTLGGLVCCNSWRRKQLDTTERLNWPEHVRDLTQLVWKSPSCGCKQAWGWVGQYEWHISELCSLALKSVLEHPN